LQYFISNSSMIIDNIDAAEGLESERNYIKGQAHFYRAFAYFTMVQMYGGRYNLMGRLEAFALDISRWYRCMAAVIRQRAITRNWVW
jgi:hypothetical protein